MEDTLGDDKDDPNKITASGVLILVLMEDTLGVGTAQPGPVDTFGRS